MSFDLRLRYHLLHAFDETGRAMFGPEWTGSEAWARERADADMVRAQRRSIIDQLNSLRIRIEDLERVEVDETDSEMRRERGDQFRHMYDERERLKRSLHDLPVLDDSFIRDSDMFKRRCAVEDELREAFRSGDLMLLQGCSTVVEWDRWANSTDFQVNYALSMIRSSNSLQIAARRGPGFVRRVEFDTWIKRFGIMPDGSGSLESDAQARNWLRAEVAKTNGKKRMKKSEYYLEAKREIPDLGRRAFERAWANEAPGHWSKSGPIKK
ncbi:MAG: hypothetical protein HUJ27_09735 [Rhodobacteraceae bacterium]|nr:hypothetical protein [Paracoccaceae bacterium]